MEEKRLLDAATAARENAYCPYSHYAVGAALLCEDGRVFVGCNVENASFGATLCAERAALAAAVTAGAREFAALALVGGPEGEEAGEVCPCGICLQALSELCGREMPVYTLVGDTPVGRTLGELIPNAFQL